MPLLLGIGILDFCGLMLVAYVAKRDDHTTVSAICGLAAYASLVWGIVGWVWSLFI
jgi:hypothetical protein